MSEIDERDYEGLEEATTCEPCEPGSADLDGDPRTPCHMCQAGRFSGARSVLCLPCDAGSRAPAGASACVSCTAGKYAPAVSDTCAPCAPGVFDHDRSPATPCVSCAPGTYLLQSICITPLCFSLSVSLSPYLSLCVCLCVSLCASLAVYVSLSVYVSQKYIGRSRYSDSIDLCVGCEPGKYDHDSAPTTPCQDCPARSQSGDFRGTFAPGNDTRYVCGCNSGCDCGCACVCLC